MTEDNQRFSFSTIPDTGAYRTLIAFDVATKFKLPVRSSSVSLRAANGTSMDCSGSVVLQAICNDIKCYIHAVISKDISNEILLSWHDMINLGLLPNLWPKTSFIKTVSEAIGADSIEAILNDFQDVISDTLPETPMKGPPMKIELKPNAIPIKLTRARPIPLHWQKEAMELINDLVAQGVIRQIEGVTEWISPAHFVPKDGGKAGIRLVTDFTQLNKFVKRPVHPFPSASEIMQSISPEARYFCCIDAKMGYYQIGLDVDSQGYTTFLLPTGKYCYCRGPMGLNSTNDEWCCRSDFVTALFEWAQKIVDDILIWAKTLQELFKRLRMVLLKCREIGLTISKKKVKIGQELKFAGFIVGTSGIKPNPEKVEALSKYIPPTDLTSLRSFLGLANQLGFFIPDLSHSTVQMRSLLKKDTPFLWLAEHQIEFEKAKSILTSDLLVQPFDPALVTELLTDASRIGLGYMLLQRDAENKPRIIKCGSFSLTPAQHNYAVIELECLAIVKAIEKCAFYLRGLNSFLVVTDHKSLLGIFKKDISDISNPRLVKYRESLCPFTFSLTWNAGKDHLIADALSRAPIFPAEIEEVEDVQQVLCYRIVEDPALQFLFDAAADDDSYLALIHALRTRLSSQQLPASHPARVFSHIYDELSLLDERDATLVIWGERIIVPQESRSEILRRLHASHQGVVKTRKAAQQLYFWPGVNNEIKLMIDNCEKCQEYRPSLQAEPLQSATSSVTAPMQFISSDLFQYAGKTYLCAVDAYSGYPFVKLLNRTSTADVTSILTSWFRMFGFPAKIKSDNGPQYRTEFDEYCKEHGITHVTSSPYFPSSNGMAESAVKNVKRLLQKCGTTGDNFELALQEFKAMPRADGYSPNQLFFGRKLRGLLPRLDSPSLEGQESAVCPDGKEAKNKLQESKVAKYNTRTVSLEKLDVGTEVYVQDTKTKKWDSKAIVKEICEFGRSYECDNGKRIFRLNRRFLRPIISREESMNVNECLSDNEANSSENIHNAEAATAHSDGQSHTANLPVAPRRSARIQSKRN